MVPYITKLLNHCNLQKSRFLTYLLANLFVWLVKFWPPYLPYQSASELSYSQNIFLRNFDKNWQQSTWCRIHIANIVPTRQRLCQGHAPLAYYIFLIALYKFDFDDIVKGLNFYYCIWKTYKWIFFSFWCVLITFVKKIYSKIFVFTDRFKILLSDKW